MRNPWERQEKEPARAWGAFVVYRDLGPTRSIAKAARAMEEGAGQWRGKPPPTSTLERWSSSWEWVVRSAAYDLHLDEIRRAEAEEEVREVGRRHARQAQELLEVLEAPSRILRERIKADPSALAEVPPEKILEVLAFGVGGAIPRLQKAERLALGMPEDVSEVALTGAAGSAGAADPATLQRLLADPRGRAALRVLSELLAEGEEDPASE